MNATATGEDRITEKAPPKKKADPGTAKNYSKQGKERIFPSPTPPHKHILNTSYSNSRKPQIKRKHWRRTFYLPIKVPMTVTVQL